MTAPLLHGRVVLLVLGLAACGGAGGGGTTSGNGTSSGGTTGSGAGGGEPLPEPGTHFEDAASDWTLPLGSPNGNGYFTIGNGLWSTVDLDGDGKLDLVVTEGATETQRSWKLYTNTGSGFSTTAIDWALPSGSPNGNGYFTLANGLWSTIDLDGDGKLDLVVTEGATETQRSWKLYTNTGSGFSTTAIDWALPSGSPNGNGYFTLANGLWSTIDLDGDGKLDLVVTEGATETQRSWKLYTNTGSGFASAASDWTLPSGSPNGNGYFTVDNGLWSTVDLDGDGKLDLVVTEAATESKRSWKRYANTGSGFASPATDWTLPPGSPNGNGYFTLANGLWSTFDLSGNKKPDLVVTEGATENDRTWKRFVNTGSGFSESVTPWALPEGSPNGNGYFTVANGLWSTVDLDHDGRPDLVVTEGATEQQRAWKLHRNVP
jgi:redox-regulated HSP33 family molecular chaperone